MRFYEIEKKYMQERRDLVARCEADIKSRLTELHLDGLVRRKKDGKIGWLWVERKEGCRVKVNFHPRKKDGTPSVNSSGWAFDVEGEFEPYEEGEDEVYV